MEKPELLNLTADIVSSHVGHNSVVLGDVAGLVQRVYAALAGLTEAEVSAPDAKVAVVSVRASIKPDYLVCMECGKKQKTLKRHLSSAHDMTPAQYRSDYGLPNDYPMTSANYSQQRGDMARAIGLGRKPAGGAPVPQPRAKAAARTKPKSDLAKPASDQAGAAKRTSTRHAPNSTSRPQADE